jgi:hypothetical protein
MANADVRNDSLLRRTLVTTGAMVGACVLFVGTLSLIAALVVGHAVEPSSSSSEGPVLVNADKLHGAATPPKPPSNVAPAKPKQAN